MLELCSLATIDPQEFYLSVQTVTTEAIVLIEEQLGGERSLLGDSWSLCSWKSRACLTPEGKRR